MKVYILANGNGIRWGNYKGVRKQLLEIDNETLLDRMIRLCRTNGVDDITICGEFDIPGTRKLITKSQTKRELFIEIARDSNEPFIMLNGDVYYTDAIIKDAIERQVNKWGHWCRLKANELTGKRWGEGYIHKVVDIKWWVDSLEELCKLCNEGKVIITNDWTINRYLAGWQDIYTHREDKPNEFDIVWEDETDDFDFPIDYDTFIKKTGKRGM